MNSSRALIAVLSAALTSGAACTATSRDEPGKGADTVLDAGKAAGRTIADATERAGEKVADAGRDVADKTSDVASDVAEASRDAVSATGAAVTDGWVTARLKTEFAEEALLRGSDIDVVTTARVVTLKGSVRSTAARERAAGIASATEGVRRVVNELVVKTR